MKREKQVMVRLNDEEHKKITEKAKRLGLTVSSFIRFLILKD